MSEAQHEAFYRIERCILAIKRKFGGRKMGSNGDPTHLDLDIDFGRGDVYLSYHYLLRNKSTDDVLRGNWNNADGRGSAHVRFAITYVDPSVTITRSFDITQPDACLTFIERTLQEHDVIPRTHALPIRYEERWHIFKRGGGVITEHVSDPPKEEPLAN